MYIEEKQDSFFMLNNVSHICERVYFLFTCILTNPPKSEEKTSGSQYLPLFA